MNPTQAAVRLSLLKNPPTPRIIDTYLRTVSVSSGAAFAFDMPKGRRSGDLVILFALADFNATASPTLVTGFTSLATNTGNSATNIGWYRIQYKYLDGSEAPTASFSATTGTSLGMMAVVIAGSTPARPPTVNTEVVNTTITGTTMTLDIGTHTATTPYGGLLWLLYYMTYGTAANAIRLQSPIGFRQPIIINKTNGNAQILCAENINQETLDPSSATVIGSTGVFTVSGISVCVRGI